MAAWSASVSTRRGSPSVKREPSSLLITWITPSSAFFFTTGTHSMLCGTSPVRSARPAWWRGSRLASSRRSGWRWRATQPAMPRSQPRRTPSITPDCRTREALNSSARPCGSWSSSEAAWLGTTAATRAKSRCSAAASCDSASGLTPSASSRVEVRARNDWWTVASSWSWRSRGWSGGGAGISPPAVTTARRAAATAARLAPSLPASGRHDPQAERPRGGGGTDSGARDQLVPGGDVALELRHHLAGEEPQARLGEIVGHAAVAEDAVERLGAGALLDVEHLLVALLGRAVDLEAEEELRHRVDSARRGHPLLHLLVGLVAAD